MVDFPSRGQEAGDPGRTDVVARVPRRGNKANVPVPRQVRRGGISEICVLTKLPGDSDVH